MLPVSTTANNNLLAHPDKGCACQMDQSVRFPVLVFFISALAWLLFGLAAQLIVSLKSHSPYFLDACEWFSYGRMYAIQNTALIYGWGGNVLFATGIWILTRLSQCTARNWGLLFGGSLFWNVAVKLGVLQLFFYGKVSSVEFFDMPANVLPLLIFASIMIGLSGMMTYRFRTSDKTFVSQLYILAALFFFPAILAVVYSVVFADPGRGIVQSVTHAWGAHNLFALWLVPVGLAAAYYLVPKIVGRPVHAYYLAQWGFWLLIFLGGWAGTKSLVGGPVSPWVSAIGAAASLFLVVVVVIVAINLLPPLWGVSKEIWDGPTLPFVGFGVVSFILAGLIAFVASFHTINELTQFTYFVEGNRVHLFLGFFSMVMFGAIYYTLPRIINRAWPSVLLANIHFFCSALGITLVLVGLYTAGWKQGVTMGDPSNSFVHIHSVIKSWLALRTMGLVILGAGVTAFLFNFAWALLTVFCPCASEERVELGDMAEEEGARA